MFFIIKLIIKKGDYIYTMKHTLNIPIQTFCVVSTLGDFTPLRFRFENSEHEIITVNINEVLSRKETNFAGINEIKYVCNALIDEEMKMFELKYSIPTHRWSFFQMLN